MGYVMGYLSKQDTRELGDREGTAYGLRSVEVLLRQAKEDVASGDSPKASWQDDLQEMLQWELDHGEERLDSAARSLLAQHTRQHGAGVKKQYERLYVAAFAKAAVDEYKRWMGELE